MTRPHNFRHADVRRAFQAASAAGVQNPRIEVHLPSGGHLVIGSGEETAPKRGADVPSVRGKTTAPVRSPDSVAKGSLPGSQNRAPLAKGGGSDRMAGRGDRTITADTDAANPQRPGSTGHRTGGDTKKLAKGGGVGGISRPARGGQCAPD